MARKSKDKHDHEGHHGGLAIGRATGIIISKADDNRDRARSKDSGKAKTKASKATSKQKNAKNKTGRKR